MRASTACISSLASAFTSSIDKVSGVFSAGWVTPAIMPEMPGIGDLRGYWRSRTANLQVIEIKWNFYCADVDPERPNL